MVVLGIDPGSRRVGYGLIKQPSGRRVEFLAAGLLSIKSSTEEGALLEIKSGLLKIIQKFSPEIMVVERLFFSRNQKTGIAVAQARGVIVLTAAERGLEIQEVSPNEVKSGVGGYGLADKRAVLKMVRLILGQPNLKLVDDASDALALAIFGAGMIKLSQLGLDKRNR